MAKNIFNPKDLQNAISRINTVQANSAAKWGKMTASQMICHASDQIRVALGDFYCADTGNWFHKTVLKWMVLAGVPFPKGKVETMPEINQEHSGTPPTSIDADKATLIDLVRQMASNKEANAFTAHPIFGKMGNKEWGRLVYIHLDYHLEQFGA